MALRTTRAENTGPKGQGEGMATGHLLPGPCETQHPLYSQRGEVRQVTERVVGQHTDAVVAQVTRKRKTEGPHLTVSCICRGSFPTFAHPCVPAVHPSIHPSIIPFLHPSTHPSTHLATHSSSFFAQHLFNHSFKHLLSIRPSIHLPCQPIPSLPFHSSSHISAKYKLQLLGRDNYPKQWFLKAAAHYSPLESAYTLRGLGAMSRHSGL